MKLLITACAAAFLLAGAASATEPMTAASAPTEQVAPAPVANAAPADLTKALYEGYFGILNAASDKPDMNTPAWWDYAKAYMTPELNARIAKTQTPDGGPLDVDFLIIAQDWKDLKIDSIKPGADDDKAAVVEVKFNNMGTATTSQVKFVKQADGWRINDIVANPDTKDSFSLDQVLKDMGF